MIPSYERIVFECPSGPKVITSSEDMPLDALRETIFDVNRGCRILLDLFTINKFMSVIVVLNTTIWSSNTTMMWEKCFSPTRDLVPKV